MILKWILILFSVINYGFMAFDGSRGLISGDYLRPQSGEYKGRLGPWSGLVEAVGIDPESTLMKCIFLILGLTGIAMTIGFAVNADWSWRGLLLISILSLWYLVPGTILSVFQIILLLLIHKLRSDP
jgi:hypothetical protein